MMNTLEILTRIVKSRYAILVGLTLLYVLVRLLVLFCAIDQVHLDEELYRGNVAKELITGAAFPLSDYQRSEYEGGSLVDGLLAVPLFLLFGEKLLSLKLVGLLVGTCFFILWYLFLDRFFNRRVAVWASLLFIFMSPLGMRASISSFGAQEQVGLFALLALFIFYRIFLSGENKKSLFGYLGAVCGFGMFFHYSFFPVLLAIVLFWYILDKKFFIKSEFFIFTIAFLAGLSPWIWYNLTHNFQGFIVYDHPLSYWFLHNDLLSSFLRFKDFVTVDLPGALTFVDPVFKFKPKVLFGHWLFSYVYYFTFLFCFCALSWFNRRSLVKIIRGLIPLQSCNVSPQEISKEAFLLVFLGVFALTFSLSGIKYNVSYFEGSIFRYRQVGPIGLFIIALIPIFFYGESRRLKRFPLYVSFGIMGLLLGLGIVSNLSFISNDPLIKVKFSGIYRGYNYYDLGRVIAWRFDGSPRWVDSIKRIKDGEARRYCYSGMGWGYAENKFYNNYHLYLSTWIHKIEKNYWPYAYEWMGEVLERKLRYDKIKGAELKNYFDPGLVSYFYSGVGRQAALEVGYNSKYALVDFRERIDEEYESFFYRGMGIELFDVLVNRPKEFFSFMNAVDKRFEPVIYVGLAQGKEYYRCIYNDFGFGIGKVGYNIDAWKKIVSKVEEKYRPLCYQRLGIEVGWRFIHDVTKYVSFLRSADQEYWLYLYKGLGIGIGWRFAYDLGGCVALIKYVDQAFWPYIYEGLGTGVARRYAYQKEAWIKESRNIPGDYKPYFEEGIKSEFDRRYGGYN